MKKYECKSCGMDWVGHENSWCPRCHCRLAWIIEETDRSESGLKKKAAICREAVAELALYRRRMNNVLACIMRAVRSRQ